MTTTAKASPKAVAPVPRRALDLLARIRDLESRRLDRLREFEALAIEERAVGNELNGLMVKFAIGLGIGGQNAPSFDPADITDAIRPLSAWAMAACAQTRLDGLERFIRSAASELEPENTPPQAA
jgi:hypothetical protein